MSWSITPLGVIAADTEPELELLLLLFELELELAAAAAAAAAAFFPFDLGCEGVVWLYEQPRDRRAQFPQAGRTASQRVLRARGENKIK